MALVRLYFKRKTYVNHIMAILLFFVAQFISQYFNGAFSNEFGGHPDEAGHYITGLMVHAYIGGHHLDSPMQFAEDYYIHYPKVALGHWPPFFYVIQAVWTLFFSPSHLSLMLLLALLTTLLAGTVYLATIGEFGSPAGIVAGLLLLALPLVQQYSSMVMAEIPVALLSFWAILCWGRFLDTEKARWALGFALCAVLAILTKGNSWALAFVAPLTLLFSRRFFLCTRLSFWYPAMVILVPCGFWYWFTLNMLRNGMQVETLSWQFTMTAIAYYSYSLVKIAGFGLTFLAAIGFIQRVILPSKKTEGQRGGKWVAVGALLVSVWLFHCVVPAGLENRYLLTAVPALLLLLAAGVAWVAQQSPLHLFSARQRGTILIFIVIFIFTGETFFIPRKTSHGFAEVVQQLLAASDWQKSIFLVSSDSTGEGMFIAEVAMRQPHPSHIILRSSKILAKSRWSGLQYRLLYNTPQEIMDYLESLPVGIVAIDHSFPMSSEYEHHQLLQKTLERYADKWEKIGVFPLTRRGISYPEAISVYHLIGHENKPVKAIRVDISDMLGKTLEKNDHR